MVFNSVIDLLPPGIGFYFGDYLINHLAYADDLVLIAETEADLQHLLNIFNLAISQVGLRINLAKSFTMVWIKDVKIKNMIYDSTTQIKVNIQLISSIAVNQKFRYLGATFTSSRLVKIDPSALQVDMKTLFAVPANPQQKIFFLRNYLLPKHYHSLIFFAFIC